MIDLKKNKENINKSVVRIFSEIISINPFIPFDHLPPKRSQGTGFFIDNKGHILTCSHVVESSINIIVDIPNISTQKYNCKLIYIVPEFDIALLKIIDYKNKHFVEMGNSDDIEISNEVFAVGFPKSLNSNGGNNIKYTLGIISGHQEGLIQTDTPINSGNSGGPLFKDNYVIGINSKKLVGNDVSNIGYSIPINYFKNIKYNKSVIIHRPKLNCIINNTDNKICTSLADNNTGIYISKVYNNSIFDSIKKSNFILTKFDNYKIDNFGYLEKRWLGEKININHILNFYKSNSEINIEYYINNKKYNKKIKLKDQKAVINYMYSNQENIDYLIIGGAIFMNLYLDHSTKIPIIKDINDLHEEKVIISYVLPNTKFNILNNIETGSIIEEINDNKISSLNDIRKVLKKPFKINKMDILKVKDTNNNVTMIDVKEIIKANKLLSKLYHFNSKNILQ